MSDPAFLADGSGIAPHIPLAKVRKVGLGEETAHVGYFLQRVGFPLTLWNGIRAANVMSLFILFV
jgi:hypothetical protein